jgi:hypothetical protein
MNESKLGFSQLRVQLQIRELLPKHDRYSTRIASGSLQGSLQTREPGLLAVAGTTQEEPLGWLLACVQEDTILSSGSMKRARGQEPN